MKRCCLLLIVVNYLFGSQLVYAHHTYSMFDLSRVSEFHGTVLTLAWRNPHVWLYISVPGEDGQADSKWGFEGTSIRTMGESGWSRKIVEPGATVTVFAHPRKNGMTEGAIVRVELPDGTILTPRPERPRGE